MCPIITVFGIHISSFLLFNTLGFVAGAILFRYRLERSDSRGINFWVVIIMVCGGAYVGSKIYYLFEEPDLFLQHPLQVFFSWNGSGWFGGFIACMLLLYGYTKRNGVSFLHFLDILIPSVPLGIILGRFACFMAGDGCYGMHTDLPWGMSFPNGVLPTLLKVHPTQLYEMTANLLILMILLRIERRSKGNGFLFGSYLIMGGIARFLVEFIRLNPIVWWGLTAPQLISAGLFLWGIVVVLRGSITKESTAPVALKTGVPDSGV